jgi:diguanylate cyclase (GGDEF)-like protein
VASNRQLAAQPAFGGLMPVGPAIAPMPEILMLALDEVGCGIVVVDSTELVSVWNRWMARHSGIKPFRAVGRWLPSVLPALEGTRVHRAIRRCLLDGTPYVLPRSRKAGPFPLYGEGPLGDPSAAFRQEVRVVPMEAGGETLALIQIRDLSQVIAREELLQKRTEQAETRLDDLVQSNRALARMSRKDFLTGVSSRMFLEETLHKEWRRLFRSGSPLSLIMLDVDRFKTYNDRYGHLKGDECLEAVAAAIDRASRRPSDLTARFGGDEFCVLLPETPEEGLRAVVERIRAEVAAIDVGDDDAVTVTVSMGGATVVPGTTGSPRDLLRAADDALLEAKRLGRDRLVVDGITAACGPS